MIITNKPDGTAVLASYINHVPHSVDIVKTGRIVSFTLEYTPGGVAKAIVNGVASAELPAPNVVLPTWIFDSPSPSMPKSSVGDVYIGANWWDVPEHRQAVIFTPLPIAVGVGLIKLIE